MSDGAGSAIRERGAWIGLILAGLSLIEVALVLARGGGYFVVVPHLAIVLPLAVVGAVSAAAALGVGERLNAIAWLGVVVLAGFGWNVCTYSIEFGRAAWGVLIPFAHPHGIDFRDGLYDPARAFTTVHSGWPPLTLYLGRPFTLLGFSIAYGVQIGILVVLAVTATVLSVKLALRTVADDAAEPDAPSGAPGASSHGAAAPPAAPGAAIDARLLGLIMGLWLLSSYGFMYGIERGNIDLYALFFSLLCVWSVLRGARSAWVPAAFLAVAVGLKLYPAILVVVLLWRYRWRAVLPLALTTLVVFLVAGPANLVHSFSTLQALSTSKTAEWWGQDSATAMAHVLHDHTTWAPSWVWYPLIGVPLALWATTLVLLVRRGWSERGAVLASAACVPLMAIVPPVSNDYKLVLCVFPLAVLAATVASLRREPPIVWIVTFGALSFAMIFLARSTILVGPSLQGSKYTLLVLVQVLLLAVVTWPRTARSAGAGAVTVKARGRWGVRGVARAMSAWAAARAHAVRRREQILYVVVGGWNTLFGYALFALLYHLLHDVAGVSRIAGSMAALIVATVLAVANNYVLYRVVVFRSRGAVRRELPRFLVVYGVALAVNLVVLPVALRELPFNVYAVQAVYTAAVIVATYVANKYFSFAPARGSGDPGSAPGRSEL